MRPSTLRTSSLACSLLGATIVLFAWCSPVLGSTTTAVSCGDCKCSGAAGATCTNMNGGSCGAQGCVPCRGGEIVCYNT
jgi:hypothetical protein